MEAYLVNNPVLVFSLLLLAGVIIVNGKTDAPNSIASAVTTGALSARTAVFLGAIFNLLGVLTAAIYPKIVLSVTDFADFGGYRYAQIGVSSALASIVVWSTAASLLGIPTSESHALFAGLSGAALALGGSVDIEKCLSLFFGLIFSVITGFLSGYLTVVIMKRLCRNSQRSLVNTVLRPLECVNTCAMSFLHGMQDGQKFIGMLILLLSLFGCEITTVPLWSLLVCAILMALGTALGGKRIIRSLGKMTKLSLFEGFSADSGGNAAILLSTLLGFPISTTHAKTAAVLGAGASKGLRKVNWKNASDMLWAWLLTFPACGILSYFTVSLILALK